MSRETAKKRSVSGKLITGLLVGGAVGATVGWLTAPASGEETRRRLQGDMTSAREKAKTAAGNLENQTRHLAQEFSNTVGAGENRTIDRERTIRADS